VSPRPVDDPHTSRQESGSAKVSSTARLGYRCTRNGSLSLTGRVRGKPTSGAGTLACHPGVIATAIAPAARMTTAGPRAWLSEVLRRACAVDPDQRYADTAEFNAALANPRPAAATSRPLPLLDRVPPGKWKLLFMLSLAANAIGVVAYFVLR